MKRLICVVQMMCCNFNVKLALCAVPRRRGQGGVPKAKGRGGLRIGHYRKRGERACCRGWWSSSCARFTASPCRSGAASLRLIAGALHTPAAPRG